MSRWFRHYAGMARDDKLVRAAMRSRQPVERVVWVYAAMLESACEIQDGGRFDIDADEVAYFLRCETSEIEAIFAALDATERTAGGVIARWTDRQYESDNSTERSRRHRERRRNANATAQGRCATPPDTETETEGTDAIASDAPSVASPSADLTPLQRVWQDYPHQIAAMAGKPEGPIRKWMGKALKAASPEAFAAAADAALRAGTRDPCAYVTAALKNTGPPQARSRDGYAEILDMLEATDEPDHSHPAEPHRDDLHRPAPFDRDARRPLVERGGAGPGRVVDLAPLRAEPRRA